ncbi:hydrolase [Lithospermum erythrorhizon]|uniref:Hydrolase n=1 Tax=Lithospermum erythrorhizon TaxID=34254 RepID=A0AAV3NMN0_LITER
MGAEASRKISASSARSHTRKPIHNSFFTSVMFKTILLVFFGGVLAYAYQAMTPPPPKICGSSGGPPVTAPRIKLKDGRYLAYKEFGVPKESAKHKIVYLHGFDSCRHDLSFESTLSAETIQSLGVYIVTFDRPGYGESDPHPKRTVKTMAQDVEQLADQLELGSKFYVSGFSMGGEAVWTCLKYIPHRLAGAALIAPVVNYWWKSFPANMSTEAYNLQFVQDQWSLRVAHYLPWLTYWWNTQKFFPSNSVIARSRAILSREDNELLPRIISRKAENDAQVRQQGEYESLHRDMMVAFGNWEFDPMDLENVFPNGDGSVHLFTGDEDTLVPIKLQRFIVEHLPWLCYHELQGSGHFFPFADGMGDRIIKALVSGRCDAS